MSSNSILIERCKNCKQHQWNTRHEEERYNTLFKEFKAALEKEGLQVVEVKKPRLGSFQISMHGVLLFSKFQSKMFPDVHSMVDYIMEFREQMKHQDKRSEVIQKYTKQVDNLNKTYSSMGNRSFRHHHKGPERQNRSSSHFSSKKFLEPFMQTFDPEKLLKSKKSEREKLKNRTFFSSNPSKMSDKLDNSRLSMQHVESKQITSEDLNKEKAQKDQQ